jgi:acetylornithine deacetylase/succinyl-diaminopimelate desuccinylase-like protein
MALIITSDEEKGGVRGAKYVREQGYLPKLLIVPDGGAFDRFASGSKGVLFFSIHTRGLTGHGAYPWRGVNADNMLTRIKASLLDIYPESSEYTEGETLTIGASHAGGSTPNNIPASACALFDFRFTTSDEETRLKERVDAILQDTVAKTFQVKPRALLLPEEEMPAATYTFLTRRDVLRQDISHPDIQRFKSLREKRLGQSITSGLDMGTNDASFWADVPTILTMPLGGYAHTAGEWLDLQSLHDFARDLMQFIQEKNEMLTGRKLSPTNAT